MAKGTLLVIEGNPGVLIVARNVLGRQGHTVHCAGTVEEGLRKAQETLPGLIILDAGFATEEVMCALSCASAVRVPLVLSAPTGLRDEVKAVLPPMEGVEIADVVEKPFTPDVLLKLVEDVLMDYEHTRPIRIDSARFKAAAPRVSVVSEPNFCLPTLFDPSAIRVTPVVDGLEASQLTLVEGEDDHALPVVPWTDQASLLAAPTLNHQGETIQETIDAEAACELIDVSLLGLTPKPLPEPEVSATPGGFGVSARARRLATRLRRASGVPGMNASALEEACEQALREEELFGGLSSPLSGGEPLVAGRLAPVGVPQIFQLAEGFSRPVCCRFEREVEAIEVIVHGRQLRFARQDNLPEIFRLGRFLIELGLLGGRNLSRAVEESRADGRRLGHYLRDEGMVRPSDVKRALERQARELVYELLAWDDGRFAVTDCLQLPPEVQEAQLELPLTGLLLDGLRRHDEWGPTCDSMPPTPA